LWWAVAEGPLRNPGEALEGFYEAMGRAADSASSLALGQKD